MTFFNRIEKILDGRKITPWSRNLGLGNNFAARAREGKVPGGDGLAIISKVERVSISWLLTGQGSPYLVSHFDHDAQVMEYIEELCAEGGWQALVIVDPNRPEDYPLAVVIMTLKVEQQRGDNLIKYLHHEVISGPVGNYTFSSLKHRLGKRNYRIEEDLNSSSINDFSNGLAGNHLLNKLYLENAEGHWFGTDKSRLTDEEDVTFHASELAGWRKNRIRNDFKKLKEQSKDAAQETLTELVKIISS